MATKQRRWIKRTLVGIGAAALVAGGVAAYADRDHHGARWGNASSADVAQWRGRFIERAASKLDLDAAQQQRLGLLFDAANVQRSAFFAGGDPRAALQGLVAGQRFDRERAAALVTEKTDLLRSGSPALIAAAADFYDGLRPEQQAEVRAMMERRR